MPLTDHRKTLKRATKLIDSIGKSFQGMRVYSVFHPRFIESVEKAFHQIRSIFSEEESLKNITFTSSEDHFVFMGIPLSSPSPSAKKLHRAMKDFHLYGFQILRGFQETEISELFESILKPVGVDSLEISEGSESTQGDVEKNYKIITLDEKAAFDAENTEYVFKDAGNPTDSLPHLEISKNKFSSFFNSYKNLLQNIESGKVIDFKELQSASSQVVELFQKNRDPASKLSTKKYFDDFTFHHSLNVCLLTTATASSIVKDEEVLRLISMAALLHDIGKSHIPAEILYKKEPLTAKELKCLKTHPEIGAEILLSLKGIPPLCVTTAYSHHIHEGEGSYPNAPDNYKLGWVAELVSVVDIYEALTAFRPYKKGLSSKQAFEIMLKMPGLKERHPFIKLLYQTIGPFPVGTIVALNSGERAEVVQKGRRNVGCPKIKLISDSSQNKITEKVELDLELEFKKDEKDRKQIIQTILLNDPDDDPVYVDLNPQFDNSMKEIVQSDKVLMAHEG